MAASDSFVCRGQTGGSPERSGMQYILITGESEGTQVGRRTFRPVRVPKSACFFLRKVFLLEASGVFTSPKRACQCSERVNVVGKALESVAAPQSDANFGRERVLATLESTVQLAIPFFFTCISSLSHCFSTESSGTVARTAIFAMCD